MQDPAREARSVCVTGAGGYVGRLLLERLAAGAEGPEMLVAVDVHEPPEEERLPGVRYLACDVRAPDLAVLLRSHDVDSVVHLAFVVTPGPQDTRARQYQIDVGGTRNVLEACLEAKVRRVVVTSSGAAYGYHADNPVPLREADALRGNQEFAYTHHKRLVEEMLARYRREHPELEQVVFRVCAVLGERASNQITALFEKPFVLDVRGSRTGFVFIWDEDLVECLIRALSSERSGVYNVASRGEVSMREIARMLGKPYVALPAGLLRAGLALLHRLGISRYGPEQVSFLRYRPVLSNERLESEFGFRPRLSSEEVFRRYLSSRRGPGA